MNQDVALGALFCLWVLAVAPSRLVATFTKQTSQVHRSALRSMIVWLGGFGVLIALYALETGLWPSVGWSVAFGLGVVAWYVTQHHRRAAPPSAAAPPPAPSADA